jgi:hypothetical protein
MPDPLPEPPPMRVERLMYQPPMDIARRPAILTAIGIISIVVSSLSLITGCITGFYGSILQAMPIPVMPTTMPATSPTVSVYSGTGAYSLPAQAIEQPELMKPGSRVMVIAAMNRLSPMSDQRQQMLDQLLKEAGDGIFPFSEQNFTSARLAGSISASGRLPGIDDEHPGNTYFVLANGRIEVADDHAVFMPSRAGDMSTVRVYRKDDSAQATAAANMPPPVTFKVFSAPAWVVRGFFLALLLNVLLAILLLVAGILTLRDSRKARPMHIAFALLKFVAIAVAVYANWQFAEAFMRAFAQNNVRANTGPASAVLWAMPAVFGSIYPLALLIALNLRSVRAYYQPSR